MGQPTGLTDNERAALRQLKEILSQELGSVALSLFGSKARGQAALDSDVDVMIEIPELNPEIESRIDDVIFEINLRYDVLISAILFGRKELEDGPLAESPLYKSVEKDGIRL